MVYDEHKGAYNDKLLHIYQKQETLLDQKLGLVSNWMTSKG